MMLLVLLLSTLQIVVNGENVVKISLGALQGVEWKTDKGNPFYSFLGIPYAEPPVDDLRFKYPVAKKPWGDKILDATKDGSNCPQVDTVTNEYIGDEDCLVLNVYTTKLTGHSDDLHPVIVYIHYGGYHCGSGLSDFIGPRKIMDHNIVLVTLNYRLGPLGFLSTADSELPGNYGLLDQLEAIKWVNKHISNFGGDPNRITISGSSAGAASVTFHMLSPLAKGLFQNAISISGSALCPWAFQPDPLIWTQKVAEFVECSTEIVKDMVECLRKTPAETLVTNAFKLYPQVLPIVLAPTVDHYFLLDEPEKLLKDGKVNPGITYITGVTKDECAEETAGILGSDPTVLQKEESLKKLLSINFGTTYHHHLAIDLIYREYFDVVDKSDLSAMQQMFLKANNEGIHHMCHYWTARLTANAGIKTYAFFYDYEAPFSVTQKTTGKVLGVNHLDDLFMLLPGTLHDHVVVSDETSLRIMDLYQRLIVNFANYSNPTPSVSEVIPILWPSVQPNKLWVYHIDESVTIENYYPESDHAYKFWTKEFPKALIESKLNSKVETKDEL